MDNIMSWTDFDDQYRWLAQGMAIGRLDKSDFCDYMRALINQYEGIRD